MAGRVLSAALVGAALAGPALAGGDPDAAAQGETLADWQAMICGVDAGDRWQAGDVHRFTGQPSGTVHAPGLWPGGWLDGFDPRDPGVLFAPRPFGPDAGSPATVPDAGSPAPDPFPRGPAPVSLPGSAWFLLGAFAVAAMLRRCAARSHNHGGDHERP